VRTLGGGVDNPSVKLPEIGNLTAPFTQGSLWVLPHQNVKFKMLRTSRGDS